MGDIAGVILDLETTGLLANCEHILEIGMMAVDEDLNEITHWSTPVWQPSAMIRIKQLSIVAEQHPDSGAAIVCKMHRENHLFEEAQQDGITPWRAKDSALEWLRALGVKPEQFPLSGSTIEFDRQFLHRWMPELDDFFHYRTINASAVKELMAHFAPGYEVKGAPKPESRKLHRVIPDCEDTRLELQWYVSELLR